MPESNETRKSHRQAVVPDVERRIGADGPFHARLVTLPSTDEDVKEIGMLLLSDLCSVFL